jgi:ssDNA-binding Zn-finger/Zn-ribbon topoisomerase 1
MAYQATCMKSGCRYTETYQVNPGARKCPKCGTSMVVKKA